MSEVRTVGEALDQEIESIVSKANAIQVRRRSLEELDEETQWVLIGKLALLKDDLDAWAVEIDTKLSALMDERTKP